MRYTLQNENQFKFKVFLRAGSSDEMVTGDG